MNLCLKGLILVLFDEELSNYEDYTIPECVKDKLRK